MARLSVCIPTWNGARHLARTLDRVLAQRHADLRVIVGDDASDDETVDVARRREDPRVSVHAFRDRLGLAGNWNRLLRLADGDYVAIVGQDDDVAPTWAARLVGLLEAHPDADLAFGRRRFVFGDEESRLLLGDFFERWYPDVLGSFYSRIDEVIPPEVMVDEAHRHRFEINLIGEPTFVVVRRSAPALASGFDASLSQMVDWEFFTRCFVDRPILHCPEILGAFRIHGRSASMGNVALVTHYREFDYLLGIVQERFGSRLGPQRIEEIARRRAEGREWRETLARG